MNFHSKKKKETKKPKESPTRAVSNEGIGGGGMRGRNSPSNITPPTLRDRKDGGSPARKRGAKGARCERCLGQGLVY